MLLGEGEAVFFWVSVGRTLAWSPVVCASREVAAQGGRHVEVADLVAGGVAVDADDAVLRLAVLVGSEDEAHGCSLRCPSTLDGSGVRGRMASREVRRSSEWWKPVYE